MGDTHEQLRIGAAQVAEVFMDREATVEKDCEYIWKAGEQGLDLLVFPEFHVPTSPWTHTYGETGLERREFYKRLFDNAVTVPGPAIDRLCEAAREADTVVVVGVTEKEPDTAGTMYNTLVFIDSDGTLLGKRRKLVPTSSERLFHAGGTGKDIRTFDSSVGTLGGLMCSEHTNQLAGFSMLAGGADLHAAAWPVFANRDRENRERVVGTLTRYQAYVGCLPTVCATGVVTDDLAESIGNPDLDRDSGTSSVISPTGETLAGPRYEGEGLVYADVDMGDRVRAKSLHDLVGHYNRFDVFTLEIDKGPQDPTRIVGDPD